MVNPTRWLCLVLWLAVALGVQAVPNKITKVLPHLLDKKGRHALSPSLYERDALQAHLRQHPELCAGMRFDVQWKAKAPGPKEFKLRLELRTSRGDPFIPVRLEQPVTVGGWFSHWSHFTISQKDYERLGQIIAWRATLWNGDQFLAELKSFLW